MDLTKTNTLKSKNFYEPTMIFLNFFLIICFKLTIYWEIKLVLA